MDAIAMPDFLTLIIQHSRGAERQLSGSAGLLRGPGGLRARFFALASRPDGDLASSMLLFGNRNADAEFPIAEFRLRLRDGCEKNRCHYVLVNTGQPLEEVLSGYLAFRLRTTTS